MTREPDAGEVVLTPLTLEREGSASNPVVRVHGEIDVATSPMLRSELAALLASQPSDVTLDLRDVSFVDSSGLGVMVGALKRLRETGGTRFVILDAQDAVRKVFDITGLSSLFEMERSDPA
jgi:anti-sigma B factor antagonist